MHAADRTALMTHPRDAKPYAERTVDEHAQHVAKELGLTPQQRAVLHGEITDALLAPYAALRHCAPDGDVHLALGAERLLKIAGAVAQHEAAGLRTDEAAAALPPTMDALRDVLKGGPLLRPEAALAQVALLRALPDALRALVDDARAAAPPLPGDAEVATGAAHPASEGTRQLHDLLDAVEAALSPVEAELTSLGQG